MRRGRDGIQGRSGVCSDGEQKLTVATGYLTEGESKKQFAKRESNGGAVGFADGEYVLTTTGANGSTAIHIGNVHGFYRPGFYSEPQMTVSVDAPNTTNVRIEWGGFGGVASSDTSLLEADALGFYVQDNVYGLFLRNSLLGAWPGNTINIPWADWSGDKTVSLADLNNLILHSQRFLWLGGRDVGWVVKDRLVHRINFDEPPYWSDQPYMLIPNLRIGVLVHNFGAAAPSTVKYNCGAVHSINGGELTEYRRGTAERASGVSVGAATRVPLMALRMSAATKSARGTIEEILFTNTGAQDAIFEIYVGRDGDGISLTGATWATTVVGAPLVQCDTAATAATIDLSKVRPVIGAKTVESNGASSLASVDLSAFTGEHDESFGIEGDGASRIFLIVARSTTATTTANARLVNVKVLGYG